MNKYDFMLTGILLILCVVSLLAFKHYAGNGSYALIRCDGQYYACLPLDENRSLRIPESGPGYNTVIIEDSGIYVSDADCPDGICINRGRIHLEGETIICLPHKLSISIISEPADDADFFPSGAHVYTRPVL